MKKRSIFLLGILAIIFNSCVYSLFPIYTEDTIVFKKELLGKWSLEDDGTQLLFETMSSDNANTSEKKDKYSIEINEGFTMSSEKPLFITQDGRKIYDEDSIKMIMRERIAENNQKSSASRPSSPSKGNIEEEIKSFAQGDKLSSTGIDYEGSVAVYEEGSYKLTATDEDGKKEAYVAHLVEIGNDLFMDLYPIKEYDSKNISDNFFPVHTFYKVEITEDQFTLIHFDMDKLNKLFESNLIRLRHENVDGTILITAQPKELQKFIDKYSDDENVFDAVEMYKKVS
ncbi:hypothetical protein [Ekhidna sp.]|uniref:hypothetical protein n=1 Tax=Ekhidna sp. TaxID=2608089 RepID=UPI003B51362E